MQQNVGHIKAEIQSLGVRMDRTPERTGGAGPAEGNTLLLDRAVVTVPTASRFVADSPYHIADDEGRKILFKNEREIMEVSYVPKPAFYAGVTAGHTPYWKIALLHGTDCLATTIVQRCAHWSNPRTRCRFCGIELSLAQGSTIELKHPDDLAEVARAAKERDGIRHVTLTTGTTPHGDKGIRYLARCALKIKEATGLAIHVQFEPPDDVELIRLLKEHMVDTVGIHIESLDMDVLRTVSPVKHAIGPARFIKSWELSVSLFGANEVSSYVVAGLGEKESSIFQGSEMLADLGVYPFIVPLRPIPGSLMADAMPPTSGQMIRIYERVSEILRRKGLSSQGSKAGCVRCGACSALPEFETARAGSS